jgi:hypothetical protein
VPAKQTTACSVSTLYLAIIGRRTLPTVRAGLHRRTTALYLQNCKINNLFLNLYIRYFAGKGVEAFELVEADGPRKTTGNLTTGIILTTLLLSASTACRTGSIVDPVFKNGKISALFYIFYNYLGIHNFACILVQATTLGHCTGPLPHRLEGIGECNFR